MPLGGKFGVAVFAHVNCARHLFAVYRAEKFIRQMLALNSLAAAEMHLIGGHLAIKIAGNEFAVMRADQVLAMLLEHQRMIRGPTQERNFRLPLSRDISQFALRNRGILELWRLGKHGIKT